MDDLVSQELATRRQQMILLGAFAGLALILAALGIYGVLSYAVTQRTREIGVRIALGAHASDVLRMVAMHGLTLAGAGLVIGGVLALALTGLMKKVLYEVSPMDAPTYATVAVILLVVSIVACVVPARRAAGLDPMVALRDE